MVRPGRSSRNKAISYVEKPHLSTHFKAMQAAARLFICDPNTTKVSDACRQCGVGENESDYRRVRRMVKAMKSNGTATILQRPAVRDTVLERVVRDAPAATAAAAAAVAKHKVRADIKTDMDVKNYAKAYMLIGKIMAAGMRYPDARARVEAETGWTIKSTSAFQSKATSGKRPPPKVGRPLYLGEDSEQTVIRAIQALRSMRLPTRKHIVINMVTNMVKTAGLKVRLDPKTEKVPESWYYSFKDRHADLFDFSATRGLEETRLKWLTAENAATHYRLLAECFTRYGIASHAEDAERLSQEQDAEVLMLQGMTAAQMLTASTIESNVISDSGGDSGTDSGSDSGSDGGGAVAPRLTSTFAWTKLATASDNIKIMKKRKRQLDKVAADKERGAEARAARCHEKRRKMLQDGQAIKASLAASDDWSSSFDKLKVAQLCALGTALGMDKVPANPKSAAQAAVRPVAAQWAASIPTTRARSGGQ